MVVAATHHCGGDLDGAQVLTKLGVVIVPAALALMLTALACPRRGLSEQSRRAPRRCGGILAFVITQFAEGIPQLADQVTRSIDTTRRWLINGPLHLRPDQINHFGDTAIQTIGDHSRN